MTKSYETPATIVFEQGSAAVHLATIADDAPTRTGIIDATGRTQFTLQVKQSDVLSRIWLALHEKKLVD